MGRLWGGKYIVDLSFLFILVGFLIACVTTSKRYVTQLLRVVRIPINVIVVPMGEGVSCW